MDSQVALAISLPLSLGIAAFGSAAGLAKAVSAAMDATGRQPEAAGKILTNMAVGCAFIEALTVYVLVLAFSLSGKI